MDHYLIVILRLSLPLYEIILGLEIFELWWSCIQSTKVGAALGVGRDEINCLWTSKLYKERVKKYHEKKLLKKDFQPRQHVLLFNSILKLFPGKLKSKWSGPLTIKKVWPYGVVELCDPQSKDPDKTWVVSGQRLKQYHGGAMERLNIVLRFDPG